MPTDIGRWSLRSTDDHCNRELAVEAQHCDQELARREGGEAGGEGGGGVAESYVKI